MSVSHVIYSRDYIHKGHEFTIWSYVDGGAMPFALQCEGLSLDGMDTREEAISRAKAHLSSLAPAQDPPPTAATPDKPRDHRQADVPGAAVELTIPKTTQPELELSLA